MDTIKALAAWWMSMVDFPALILLIILALGGWVLWKTQKNPDNDFDFSDMLRDEFNKPSAFRLAIFVCLGVSTWAIMYMLVNNKGKIDAWIFIAYMAIWSGAKVADKLVDAYSGRLPNSPSNQDNTSTSTETQTKVETQSSTASKSKGKLRVPLR